MYDIRRDIPVAFILSHMGITLFFPSECDKSTAGWYLFSFLMTFACYNMYLIHKQFGFKARGSEDDFNNAIKASGLQLFYLVSFMVLRAKPIKCEFPFLYTPLSTFFVVFITAGSYSTIIWYKNDRDLHTIVQLFSPQNNKLTPEERKQTQPQAQSQARNQRDVSPPLPEEVRV